jgi:phospholipase C
MTHRNAEKLHSFTRRQFLKTAGVASGALTFGISNANAARRVKTLPKPQNSGIEHIIVVCMENRSFDHTFGTLRGVRGFNDPRAIKLPNKNEHFIARGNYKGARMKKS